MSAVRVGIVALAMVTVAATGAPAALAIGGCSNQTCVNVVGDGHLHVTYVDAIARSAFHGRFHIWGPGFDVTSGSADWPAGRNFRYVVAQDLPSGQAICAEGFAGPTSVGRACEQIRL